MASGVSDSALFYPEGKGSWLGTSLWTFNSTMAQNFWLASFAFIVCFVLTAGISLATARTKSDADLKGLVYSLTPKTVDENQPWFLRPAFLGSLLLVVCVVLNIVFF